MGALSLLVLLGTSAALVPSANEPAEAQSATVPDVEPDTKTETTADRGAIGPHWLFATGKAMPGLTYRAGHRMVWVDLETSLVFLTKPSTELDSPLLGNQLGAYFAFRPLYGKRGELTTGIGSDAYWLWGIHGDAWEVSLSLRLAGHAWLTRTFGVFATARAYPVATSGLELGVNRDGTRGLPVLFGAGVEWRLQ